MFRQSGSPYRRSLRGRGWGCWGGLSGGWLTGDVKHLEEIVELTVDVPHKEEGGPQLEQVGLLREEGDGRVGKTFHFGLGEELGLLKFDFELLHQRIINFLIIKLHNVAGVGRISRGGEHCREVDQEVSVPRFAAGV